MVLSVTCRFSGLGAFRAMGSARPLTTTANPLPATFLRGGTSKGIFLRRYDLPEDPTEWTPIFQGIMGSPDPQYRRQLNGMGGGVSSLSKVCVVGPPSPERAPEVDVEYTFVQVGVDDGALDLSGNCGNLSSMVGVFALDEGLCVPRSVNDEAGLATVRSYNTNTRKILDTTFPISRVDDKPVPRLDIPQMEMAGVPGQASRIVLKSINPAGARTGKLLPTGNAINILESLSPFDLIPASLVDATNPTVFISSRHLAEVLGLHGQVLTDAHYTSPQVEAALEAIRRAGAKTMKLDPSAKAQPKIAVLSEPTAGADIDIHAYSMGVLHKAVPMTVGLCLGVAAGVPGTLVHEIVGKARSQSGAKQDDMVKIRHPGGMVEVGAEFADDGTVLNVQVLRTGRRLMKGSVWW
ncbi:PrpF protein [Lenzites betulinus]|nr:PrpF protein [Lenzites betulinus]